MTSLMPQCAKASRARSGAAVTNSTGTSPHRALPRMRSNTSTPFSPGSAPSRTRPSALASGRPAAAAVRIAGGPFLFLFDDPLDVWLVRLRQPLLDGVEHDFVLLARSVGDRLSGVAFLVAVGVAQAVYRIRELVHSVGVLGSRGRRRVWALLRDLGELRETP